MPYIPADQRRNYCARQIDTFTHPGQLNYAISDLLTIYQKDRGLSYQTINDILGALEGAKAEYYRRVAVPYEDTKIQLNGDIYGI